jgi:uncharacterized protein (TIGR02118 family)
MNSVVVLYPNQPSSRFDLDYYVTSHLPLVRKLLGPMGMRSLTYTAIPSPDAEAPSKYRLIAELRFDDAAATQRALLAHGAQTQADISNFTDVAPVILIGDTHCA